MFRVLVFSFGVPREFQLEHLAKPPEDAGSLRQYFSSTQNQLLSILNPLDFIRLSYIPLRY